MKINIKGIGQLNNFECQLNKKINIIYAENATGKSTFSRLLNYANNEDNSKTVLNNFLKQNYQAEIKLKDQNLIFKNKKWTNYKNNFYVFNSDYYRNQILVKLGKELHISSGKKNYVRFYLECWKIIMIINQCQDEKSLFNCILSTYKILSFINFNNYRPIFNWYYKLNEIENLNEVNQSDFINKAKGTFYRLKKINSHEISIIKLINFINNAYNKFKQNSGNIDLDDYESLMFTRSNNRIINNGVSLFVFWKLSFIYCLINFLYKIYSLLPKPIKDKYDLLKEFSNANQIKVLSSELNFDEIADDIVNNFLKIIGLGSKFKIVNHELKHRFYLNQNIKWISGAENRLIALCVFLSQTAQNLKNDRNSYVVIDDPINSMDSNYTLNIVRLITTLIQDPSFSNINWIIMTHDANFCDELSNRFYRDNLNRDLSFCLWYLDKNSETKVHYYYHYFDSTIKRLIDDIMNMSQNFEQYSLIDVCNKVRILFEIYCKIYTGGLKFHLLYANRDCFTEMEKNQFNEIIDLLNRYSHGGTQLAISSDPLIVNIKKILAAAIKLIKVYSTEIWNKY